MCFDSVNGNKNSEERRGKSFRGREGQRISREWQMAPAIQVRHHYGLESFFTIVFFIVLLASQSMRMNKRDREALNWFVWLSYSEDEEKGVAIGRSC